MPPRLPVSRLAAACLALAVLPQAASAQDCDNAMTQSEMTACAQEAFATADANLNEAYAAAMDVMRDTDDGLPEDDAGAVDALRTAQRAWITFRDAACTAEGFQMRGGSAEPMVVAWCQARLTEVRAEDLWLMGAPY